TITGWAPATDPTTPITGYELERSVDGGSWSTVDATTAAVRSAIGTQTFNHAYQYRIRARDSADNWSTWVPGPTVTSVLVPDTSSAVRYGGTWHRSANVNASGGSTIWATNAGCIATLTFSGRGIAIVAPVGPTRGSATIYIDGKSRGSVSFKAS